jgi:hypothetical protein
LHLQQQQQQPSEEEKKATRLPLVYSHQTFSKTLDGLTAVIFFIVNIFFLNK